jgi:maltose alpha-D-glucosyltransferase/alpha-amylase
MLGGDRRRLKLAFSLLCGLPGATLLAYGDEIGMGDNLTRPQREAVRPPMQWVNGPNAGFSTAPPAALAAPVIARGPFGYERVNVADQQRDAGSLLQWVRRLFHTRRACPEIARDACALLDVDEPSVVACRWSDAGSALVTLHNLAPEPRTITHDRESGDAWEPVFGGSAHQVIAGSPVHVTLEGYGYRWLRAGRR